MSTPPEPAASRRSDRRWRRRALWLTLILGAGALLLIGCTHDSRGPAAEAPPAAGSGDLGRDQDQVQPNVIVVLTDDMRADELRFLPAVRRLQRSGVTFSRAISADSLCCPARATLLTGKLAHNHRTIGNSPETHGGYQVFAAHNDLRNLLPHWLDRRGYRTAWIGKYLNNIPTTPHFRQPTWSYFAAAVQRVYSYTSSQFLINGRLHTDDGYREVFARHLLLDLVRHWAPGRRPFFVLYSALAPHNTDVTAPGGSKPPVPQAKHRDFDTSRLRVAPSVGELDLSDKPRWLRDFVAEVGPRGYPRRLEARRVEALLSVNDTVRDLMSTLRRLHEARRTLVVFTSDNGFMLHEHHLGGKNKAYDESLHVPLVLRGPGFRGGAVEGDTVSLADVTATVRTAAGVTAAHAADGVPLQSVRAAPRRYASRPIEIEGSTSMYPEGDALPTDAIGRFYSGAVWGPYSYVQYETGDREFYDRSTDPWELDNTYTRHPAPGSPQALLHAWYDAHVNCRGAACNDPIDAR